MRLHDSTISWVPNRTPILAKVFSKSGSGRPGGGVIVNDLTGSVETKT